MAHDSTKQPWQFSLIDFVEISAAVAPSVWCIQWQIWSPADKKWLIALMITGGLLTFLISHYFRGRGWAYSLAFTFAGGLAFVIWLPSRAALWFPQVVSERLHQLSVFGAEQGRFSLIAALTLSSLTLLGAYTGYCTFKCIRRIAVAFTESSNPSSNSAAGRSILGAFMFMIEVVPVTALGTWIGFDLSQPKIIHVRRIDPANYFVDYTSDQDRFQAWALSRDGKRLLAIDQQHGLLDISISSGVNRVAGRTSPSLKFAEGRFPIVEVIRECRDGVLLVIEQSPNDRGGYGFQFVEIATGKPIASTRFPIPADARVMGLSPSGRLLVTQSSISELPGASSLLVWELESMEIRCELDASILSEGASEYTVLLNDDGTLFAADIPKGETDAGRSVTVYSNEMEIVARLRRVECHGDIRDPPLIFANGGKWVFGRFAGLRDPLANSYPVLEQIFSFESPTPQQSAASEYGGMNLSESIVLDPFHDRVLRLDFASELDRFNSSALGEEVDLFPILGIQCRQQVMRRRLRLSAIASGGRTAVSTAMVPLTSREDLRSRYPQPYSLSLRSAQFSRDGLTVITVDDHNPISGCPLDFWRLPALPK